MEPITSTYCTLCDRKIFSRKQIKIIHDKTVCRDCRNNFVLRRYTAYALDLGLWWAVTFIYSFFLGYLFRGFSGTRQEMRLIAIVMGWGTYPIFCLKDGFGGYSPGKKLMGLQTLDLESGKPVSFAQSFKRNLPTIIPLIPLVMAFQISTGQRWGDRWAKTTVVWKKYDESPVFLHRLKKSELIDNLTK